VTLSPQLSPASTHPPPAKEAARIAGMFDAIAGRYDLLNSMLSMGLDQHWRARAVKALNLTGRETVLDLCTGTADLALAAMRGNPRPRRVIGVDFAAGMLLLAKKKVGTAGAFESAATAIDLVRGDATRLPLGDGTLDAVTIGFGIRNVEDPVGAFREILRVLRQNGVLAILEFSLPRAAMVRSLYLWYFRNVLPRIGRAISKHPSAYTYLPESVEAFPSPEAFVQQLRSAGFATARAVPLTFGVVYLFVATRSDGGAAPA
jgi:demethylmenaquinone methyltransferase / 2-methoxy-6-polyprenyl-1,4-benzoquinol methylase